MWAIAAGVVVACALAACAGGTSSAGIPGSAATKGPVTITTNLSAYSVNDAIGVTVSNTSKSDYFAVSGKSACVIIELERYNPAKSTWVPTDMCALTFTPQSYAIAQGAQQQFTLAPNSSADENAWQPGLYRVSVVYSAKGDGVTDPQQANCAAFRIN